MEKANISPEVIVDQIEKKNYILEKERKILEENYDKKVRQIRIMQEEREALEKENKELKNEIQRQKEQIKQIVNTRGYQLLEKVRHFVKRKK